jgi:hypothetical protein
MKHRGLIIVTVLTALLTTGAGIPSAHGPGGHGGVSFTALSAAKKGIELYDRLVAGGKIDETWETELVNISVSERALDNRNEYVVQFERAQGDPRSVYIFFDTQGEYLGSNFTGK